MLGDCMGLRRSMIGTLHEHKTKLIWFRLINDLQSEKIKLRSTEVPYFLYSQRTFEPEDIMAGFLMGHVLIRVCRSGSRTFLTLLRLHDAS